MSMSDFRRATSGLGHYGRPGPGGTGSAGSAPEKFSVAIVNDSAMAVVMLKRVLEPTGKFSIAWTASDGLQALESCHAVRPDLILMDLVMPVMDGIEATRQIMQQCPCSILIVTSSVDSRSEAVFQAMDAGALDVVRTPRMDDEAGRSAFLLKVETLAWLVDRSASASANQPTSSPITGITGSGLTPVKPKGALLSQLRKPTGPVRLPGVPLPSLPPPLPGSPRDRVASRLVILGCSAGGPAALSIILKRLPRDLSAVVVIVQ
ncbi:MAG: response regulator, partial [Candidatus Methylacidiphilales bacterium]